MKLWLFACGVLLIVGLIPGSGQAAELQPQAMVEAGLAELLPARVTPFGWAVLSGDGVLGAVCAPREGPVLRLGLVTRPLSGWQRQSCVAAASAGVSDRIVGRLVVLAFGGGSSPALTSALLYRALARQVPGTQGDLTVNTARRWRDLDPALPDALIRVLVPSDGSVEARILADRVLETGCLAVAMALLPRSPAERRAICTALRTDTAVEPATPRTAAGTWLLGAGPSAVALVGLQAVRADDRLEVPLPLDGVAPGFASIADGTYRPTLAVHLIIAQAGAAAAAANAVNLLTAESVIGPGGGFAQRGFAALTAMERVRLRAE